MAQSASCFDACGLPVSIQEAPIADYGHASINQAGEPFIVLNAGYLKQIPTVARKFVLYHECGHHALGHLIGAGSSLTEEQAADCWAVRWLMLAGEFGTDDFRTVSEAISKLNRGKLHAAPGGEPWRAVNLRSCVAGLPPAGLSPEDNELTRYFQWPMVTSSKANVHFFLRTRFRNGELEHVATVTDSKGHTARHFSSKQDRSNAPPIQIAFSGNTISIPDAAFLRIAETGLFEATGESACTEESYKAALKASRATMASTHASHSWIVPPDLQ